MPRHETCPTCKRTPVRGKTWSLLTAQDKVLGRQRARIVELEEENAKLQSLAEWHATRTTPPGPDAGPSSLTVGPAKKDDEQ